MKAHQSLFGRVRDLGRNVVLAVVGLAVFGLPALSGAVDAPDVGLTKIGIIGAGKMGGTLAELWAKAGYPVMIASRHPEELHALAQSIGPMARVGAPAEAATYGNVVVMAVPYGSLPQVGRELAPLLAGKIVIDLGNPYPERDGQMAVEARREGTGVASAKFLPGVRLVRAFNAISFVDLRKQAHRAGDPVAIPIASNDTQAIAVVSQLVRAAGFAPVVVGPLSTAKSFDVGTPVYVKALTAAQLRAQLGLPAR